MIASSKRVYLLLPALLTAYLPLAFAPRAIPDWQGYPEIFPFFSWNLFGRIPQPEAKDYSVRLTHVDGDPLGIPTYYADAGPLVRKAQSINAYSVMQRLGTSSEKKGMLDLDAQRRAFEETHLRPEHSYRYELVRRHYNPVTRWRTGQFDGVDVVGTFRAPARRGEPQ